ncbi:MAG: fructosamine kinase family protein, partial [Anaerolineales bacterium]|nr:fructosamine kinase family protein [Anaerolineales bacterium]
MELLDRLEEVFGQRPLAEVNLPGGSIGEVHLIKMADGEQLVAKLGGRAEGGLLVEAAMLRYLAGHSQLPVPAVIYAEDTLLILEFLPGRSEFSPAAEADAARHLAALHTITAPRFGFDSDTLIGAFSQPNPWSED